MMTRGRIVAQSPAVLLARIADQDGNVLTRAGISAVALKVWDAQARTLMVATNPAVADVIFDTLQLDARWTADGIGYNLAVVMQALTWPPQGVYHAEVKITPLAGDPFYAVWELQAVDVLSE